MINKNVILTPTAQWSLVLFLGSIVVSILSMWILGTVASKTDLNIYIVLIPPLLTAIVYATSCVLGFLSLKTSKFPLVWVAPCLIMTIVLSFTIITDFSRMTDATSKTITRHQTIEAGKAIGVSLRSHGDTPTLVEAVFYKSPAENAGVKNGDIIKAIDGKVVSSKNDVVHILNQIEIKSLELTISRNGQDIQLEVIRYML
jgi:membrane-associated protease RseP (regulator of RpoE activity)